MCEKDETLFGWIDVERLIKWTSIKKKNQKYRKKSKKQNKQKNQKIKKQKKKKIKKQKKKEKKEFVCSSFGQNVRLLSLPNS